MGEAFCGTVFHRLREARWLSLYSPLQEQASMFYLQTEEKAERVGFEPTRRLDTAYAISTLKRAHY